MGRNAFRSRSVCSMIDVYLGIDAFAKVAASGEREAAHNQMCLIFAAMAGANVLALGLNQDHGSMT
jgi:hypothetical protein